MTGCTLKLPTEVPVIPFAVTEMCPVVAPSGTVVTIDVAVELSTVAVTPLNITVFSAAVVLKFVPWIVTVSPTLPLDGKKPVIMSPQPARTKKDPMVTALPTPCMIFIAVLSFS
jgi:hypothetical protein